MKLKNTKLHILQKEENLETVAETGVSLHCHTLFSKEILDFVPYYAERIPIVKNVWQKERDKYFEKYGREIDFTRGFWLPPMSENEVYSAEKAQIEKLGLNAIVSITDHDAIEGNLRVCKHTPNELAPISLEWTIPYQNGFFHIGVHNLPKGNAAEISQQLLTYTFSKDKIPNNERLHELFKLLNEMPEVLIIFNHPLWDIEMIGAENHKKLLIYFLAEHGKWIHALEVNGFRSWSENKAVIELAESLDLPICTGGDRHGCQSNTVLNLSKAMTFAEFTDEVRKDKYSEIVILPEYKQPLRSRQLQSFAEILAYHKNFPEGRKRWFDRVYFDIDGNGMRSLADYGWKYGGPFWVRWIISTLSFLGNPRLRPMYQIFNKSEDAVPESFGDEQTNLKNQLWLGKKEKLVADN